MLEPISVRPAGDDDLPEIASLARAIWPICYREIISPAQIRYMLERMYSLEQLRADLSAGVSFDLLVENGRAIGFAGYGPVESNPGECKLHKLYLHPSHHRRGYGSRLLKHVIETARSGGYSSLALNVNKNNTIAIEVYKRHGFAVREAVVVDIGGGFVMDDYVMVRTL
ncbi:MAG TPA: GNAT family N-acetyltransferase [Phycisphaerae bacterium]|nr:GNAT family N-acetyltransferase [Phycisphaerae bacterium]